MYKFYVFIHKYRYIHKYVYISTILVHIYVCNYIIRADKHTHTLCVFQLGILIRKTDL